jgi:hypothetical protein
MVYLCHFARLPSMQQTSATLESVGGELSSQTPVIGSGCHQRGGILVVVMSIHHKIHIWCFSLEHVKFRWPTDSFSR